MRPALGMKSCIIRLPIMQEDRGEKMVGIVLNDNAYEQDMTLFRGILRMDVKAKDKAAFKNGVITVDDATVSGS